LDKLTELHLKEWKSYKSRLEKDIPTATDFWKTIYEYRINALEGLIEVYEE
jgi:hypothetical protein